MTFFPFCLIFTKKTAIHSFNYDTAVNVTVKSFGGFQLNLMYSELFQKMQMSPLGWLRFICIGSGSVLFALVVGQRHKISLSPMYFKKLCLYGWLNVNKSAFLWLVGWEIAFPVATLSIMNSVSTFLCLIL